jgi:hypothetical protein
VADKEKELLALLELAPIQIWNTDLDRFLEEWDVRLFFIYFWHAVFRKKKSLSLPCPTPFFDARPCIHATESLPRVGGQGCGRLE